MVSYPHQKNFQQKYHTLDNGFETVLWKNGLVPPCPILLGVTAYELCISQFQAPTSPRATPREFFKVVKFPAPGQKIFVKLRPQGKKIDKNPAPRDNFVDLQENFAMILMIVKPFAFFWYSSLAWLSSSFFKDYKACEYKISQ